MKYLLLVLGLLSLFFLSSCQTVGRTIHSVGRSVGVASVQTQVVDSIC